MLSDEILLIASGFIGACMLSTVIYLIHSTSRNRILHKLKGHVFELEEGIKVTSESFESARKQNEITEEQKKDLEEQNKNLELKIKDLLELSARQEQQIAHLKSTVNSSSFDGRFPICARCKDIRDAGGSWHPIEEYIANLSEAEFSHSLCEDCARELYPDMFGAGKKMHTLTWR